MSKWKAGAAGICSVAVIIGVVVDNFRDEIRTSPQALAIIGDAEGCRREPYLCPSNVLTVGIGSTEYSGNKIALNHRYTDHEIATRWVKDIKTAERCVNQFANGDRLPQSVFDAAVSLTFNVGCGAVKHSTMFRKLRNGDYVGGCGELAKWVYANGRKLRGLEIRREKERALCLADLTK